MLNFFADHFSQATLFWNSLSTGEQDRLVEAAQIATIEQSLSAMHINSEVVSLYGGSIVNSHGSKIEVDQTFLTTASVLYDAIYVPGGDRSIEALTAHGDPLSFIYEAFKHFKPIAATGEGVDLLMQANLQGIDSSQVNGSMSSQLGVIASRDTAELATFATTFIDAIKQHRFWTRPIPDTASVKAAAERMLMEKARVPS